MPYFCLDFLNLTIFSIHKESFHFYIDLINLLYIYYTIYIFVNAFDLYNEYNICLSSLFNFIESFPACI